MTAKFELGHVVMTRGVADWSADDETGETNADLLLCLSRHADGDWGEVCDEDKDSNEYALNRYLRLLSAYTVQSKKIWIITEADRSATTILFPDEY